MQLKERFLLLVVAVAISVSLFAGLVVIVDNVSAAPIRHFASVNSSVDSMSEHIDSSVQALVWTHGAMV